MRHAASAPPATPAPSERPDETPVSHPDPSVPQKRPMTRRGVVYGPPPVTPNARPDANSLLEAFRAHRVAHHLAQVHAVHHRSRARDDVRIVYPVTVAVVRSVVHDEGRVADHGVRPRRVGEDQADIAPVSLKVVPHEDVSARLPREYAAARRTGDHVRAKGAAQHECCQKRISREPDAVDGGPLQLILSDGARGKRREAQRISPWSRHDVVSDNRVMRAYQPNPTEPEIGRRRGRDNRVSFDPNAVKVLKAQLHVN